jgi:Tol biopolymer transport system component
MSRDRFDVLERFAPLFERPDASFHAFLRRRERKRRNQRIVARAFAIAIFVVPAVLFAGLISFDRSQRPAAPRPSLPGTPAVDYVIDLETEEMYPLPDMIIRTLELNDAERARCVARYRQLCVPQYSTSRGGSLLAYVGAGDDGTPEIFIAGRSAGESPGIAGSEPSQVTHDPRGAISPAWSPDGTMIAYVGYGAGDVRNLFVLDVATGESTQVTHAGRDVWDVGVQFTPDGTSLLYTGGTDSHPEARIVPVTGGNSALFIEPGSGLNDAGNGSLSPDGSLVTYMAGGSPLAPDGSPLTYHGQEITHAGPGRFLSKVDGTGFRFLPGAGSNPSGTWSPDGTRIVCSGDDGVTGGGVIVIDVATGDITHAVEGRSAIWLDDHRLLVEV